MQITDSSPVLKVNAPEWYARADFLQFLNGPTTATWHVRGTKPNEYSDVFVWVSEDDYVRDPDCDLPEDIEQQLVNLLKERPSHSRLIWITNLT